MVEDEHKRAYNALLTLMKDDSKTPRKKIKKNSEPLKSEPKPSVEESVDAVEGLDSDTNAEDGEDDEPNIEIEDDNEGDSKDPFETHFANPPSFDAPSKWQNETIKTLPILGDRSLYSRPVNSPDALINVDLKPLSTKAAFSKVKHRLHASFFKATGSEKITPLQSQLAPSLFNYQDLFVTKRTWDNWEEYLDLVTLHLLNHTYKTRDRVLKNNTRLKENGNDAESEDLSDIVRDQGFTRPKVLVLLPTRDSAYDFVTRLRRISGLNQMEKLKRFKTAFYESSADLSSKPEDFQKTFAGNSNEVFCLGIKLTRQAIKLYSSFYGSDIIVASPLGLRLIIDKKDFDFLSSIEVCLCDQVEAIAMQSWTNMRHIFEKLNCIPKNPHDCDFSRVREWYLDEKAKYLRQTILMSPYATPEMLSIFNKLCFNVAGKLRTRSEEAGLLSSLRVHIRQVFTRIGVSSFAKDSSQRFEHFVNQLLPNIMRGAQVDGVVIVAPNYTEFVMLRNYLEKNDYSYVSLSEYSSPSQVGRGRTFFADGRAKIMLYSARLHHYRRYGIKGVRTVVFYGLPDNPIFYNEFVQSLARTVVSQQVDPDLLKIHVLFSKWDALKLERIVGTQRMAGLIEGNNDTHEFY